MGVGQLVELGLTNFFVSKKHLNYLVSLVLNFVICKDKMQIMQCDLFLLCDLPYTPRYRYYYGGEIWTSTHYSCTVYSVKCTVYIHLCCTVFKLQYAHVQYTFTYIEIEAIHCSTVKIPVKVLGT